MGLVNVGVNNVSLDDDNFGDDDPKTMNHVGQMAWFNKYKHCKACKKQIKKELMFGALYPTEW